MNTQRRLPTLIILIALGFLAYAIARSPRPHGGGEDTGADGAATRPQAQAAANWTPNETVTGDVLAANFAQDQHDWATANTYLDKLSDPNANDPTTMLRMMLLALSAGQFDRAAQYAAQLDNIDPDQAQGGAGATVAGDGHDLATVVLLARAVRGGDLVGAQKLLGTLRSPALVAFVQPVLISWIKAGRGLPLDSGVDGLALLQALHRGLAAEWAGQTDVANRVFDALARVPLTPSGTLMIAAYNIRQHRTEQARAALNEALRLNPMDKQAKAWLDALDQGRTPDMPAQYSYHLKGVTAGVGLAFMDLAQTMLADHAADSALIFAQLGRMIRGDVPGLALLVGTIFEEQKREADAAAIYEGVQPGDPDYVDAQIRLAQLRAAGGKTDQAESQLESLLEKSPEPRIAYALGEIYRDAGDYSKAVASYDRAVQMSGGRVDDDLWSVYFVRAMAEDELGEWPKAEADLKTALEYRPENPQVLNFLGYSWADKNLHLAQARQMLMRA
ncbi:MAG: tetratricopeptide repeat protein, partial [Alphaproteobacteria bacterium]|nr:tetratricopeptide repeat protein [Alphaproteobacteria bacterium]